MASPRALILASLPWLVGPGPTATTRQADHARAIAAATLPLPPGLRAAAGVVDLDRAGTVHVWRASANGLVCLSDPPGDSTFDVRCYRASFIPLLYRLRQLAAARVTGPALARTIDAEIHTGKLKIAQSPTAGFRMLGPIAGYDSMRNTVSDTIDAWQSVHIPYRTAASLGLPEGEDGTHPYVMASGTFWAHVMIMQRALRY